MTLPLEQGAKSIGKLEFAVRGCLLSALPTLLLAAWNTLCRGRVQPRCYRNPTYFPILFFTGKVVTLVIELADACRAVSISKGVFFKDLPDAVRISIQLPLFI